MFRNISGWDRLGYGGKSTLDKEELRSPENEYFLIKYPRRFKVGVSWEDITELIAAEIGSQLGLKMMEVEIVERNGRRGCLLKNFTVYYESNDSKYYQTLPNEEGGALLNIFEDYPSLLESNLKGEELIDYGFSFIKRLPYWENIQTSFIEMQFFDILIGNQDRHPFNWMLMFQENGNVEFSPLYDNGASLGFRFDDQQLRHLTLTESELNKYLKNAKVKAGLFEHKQVKAREMFRYLIREFPKESRQFINRLDNFDEMKYKNYIHSLSIISEAKKLWLMKIISFRINKIYGWIREEGER